MLFKFVKNIPWDWSCECVTWYLSAISSLSWSSLTRVSKTVVIRWRNITQTIWQVIIIIILCRFKLIRQTFYTILLLNTQIWKLFILKPIITSCFIISNFVISICSLFHLKFKHKYYKYNDTASKYKSNKNICNQHSISLSCLLLFNVFYH